MAKIDLKNTQKKTNPFFFFQKNKKSEKKEMETDIPENFQFLCNNAITNGNSLIKALGSIWNNYCREMSDQRTGVMAQLAFAP